MKNINLTPQTSTLTSLSNRLEDFSSSTQKMTSLLMTCLLAIGAILFFTQPVLAEASDINYTEYLLPMYNSNLENREVQNKTSIPFEDIEMSKLIIDAKNIYWCPGEYLEIPIKGISDDYQNIEISIVLGQNGVLLRSTEMINKADGIQTFRFKNIDRHLKIGDNVRLDISKYVPQGNTKPTLLNVDFSNISIFANSNCK